MQKTPVKFVGREDSPGEGISYPLQYSWASPVAQLVKNPLAMWETWDQSLGWEDPLEKGKTTAPVFWPGEFHGLYSPWGRSRTQLRDFHFSLSLPEISTYSDRKCFAN